jgi:hypothetical protein
VLSLDIKLQKMVEELYGNRRGALVAIDPRNGEVLAMVSKPTYDLNLFVDGIDTENWAMLNESIDRPLLNRALRGTYPPGSTFKPFMAIAGWKAASARRTPPSGQRQLDVWRPHLPLRPPERPDQSAPLHHQVVQCVLLHAGQRHGRGCHPRLLAPWALAS